MPVSAFVILGSRYAISQTVDLHVCLLIFSIKLMVIDVFLLQSSTNKSICTAMLKDVLSRRRWQVNGVDDTV